MSDFAAALDVPVSTATHTADRLAKKGLITRVRPENDRRVVQVEISSAGSAVNRATHENRLAMARDMLAPLTTGEREIFLELMAKISDLAKRDNHMLENEA